MSERKVVIKNTDISEEMQQYAVDCAKQALERYNTGEDIANFIKEEFDKKYNPKWPQTLIASRCLDLDPVIPLYLEDAKRREWNHIHFSVGQFSILLFMQL